MLPFGDYQRQNGRQMQKCSMIVQEQNLRLEPHLIAIVVAVVVGQTKIFDLE